MTNYWMYGVAWAFVFGLALGWGLGYIKGRRDT